MNVCITTYNRFDLCDRLVDSLMTGTVTPNSIIVLNTRGGIELKYNNTNCICINSVFHLGLAEAFNWFIDNVQEDRLICNDDIVFSNNTLEEIVKQNDTSTICSPIAGSNFFSVFTLPNTVINAVGRFDEMISPKYYYFEDNDYMRRIQLLGIKPKSIVANVEHLHSSTLSKFTPDEIAQHHKKFRIAQMNYTKKWNGLPGFETFETPYGK